MKTYPDLVREAKTRIPEVSASDGMRLQREHPGTVIIDCREPNETALGTIAGSVVIPRGVLEQNIERVASARPQGHHLLRERKPLGARRRRVAGDGLPGCSVASRRIPRLGCGWWRRRGVTETAAVRSALCPLPSVPHPLLDSHPLFPLLAADLRARPGLLESDDGDPARAAVAIVLRAASHESRVTSHDDLPSHESRVTSHHWRSYSSSVRVERATPGAVRSHSPAVVAIPTTPRSRTRPSARRSRKPASTSLPHGLVLGTLDELRPRTPVLPPIIVTPFVAVVPPDLPFQISDELADAFWAPWSTFADPSAHR